MARVYVRKAKSNPKGIGRWEVRNGTKTVSSHLLKNEAKKKATEVRRKKKVTRKK